MKILKNGLKGYSCFKSFSTEFEKLSRMILSNIYGLNPCFENRLQWFATRSALMSSLEYISLQISFRFHEVTIV
jgi:hypothetical protein